jgi:PAS domain-containing protein
MDYPTTSNDYLCHHITVLRQSFKQLLGRDLIEPRGTNATIAQAVFFAPFAVLSHDNAADRLFNYANLKALDLFGYPWDELIGLPSRLSAEPANQVERKQSLAKAMVNGFVEDYQGVRITKTGKHFMIKNAIIWNVVDADNRGTGQAACFDEWTFL